MMWSWRRKCYFFEDAETREIGELNVVFTSNVIDIVTVDENEPAVETASRADRDYWENA